MADETTPPWTLFSDTPAETATPWGSYANKPSYDTPLAPWEEHGFQAWAGDRAADTEDYDLKGYYTKYGDKPLGEGHLTDEFKKPNHPTFSNESIYHGVNGNEGGQWAKQEDGSYSFTPGATNLQYRSPDELQDYFDKVEPGNTLITPKPWTQYTASKPGSLVPEAGASDSPEFDSKQELKAKEIATPQESTKQSWYDYLFTGNGKGDRKMLLPERIEKARPVLKNVGIEMPENPTPGQFQDAIEAFHTKNAENLASTLPKPVNKLLGTGGEERYQLWPERMVRSLTDSAIKGATLPRDVLSGKISPDSPEFTERTLDLATFGILGVKPLKAAIDGGSKAGASALSEEEWKALANYTGAGYMTLNNYLRGKPLPPYIAGDTIKDGISPRIVEKVTEQTKLLDQLIQKSPPLDKDITVYRGTSYNAKNDYTQDLVPGKEVLMPGFTSTSTNQHVAEYFQNPKHGEAAFFQIKVPKGSKAIDVAKHEDMPGEREILLPRDSFFKVLSEGIMGKTRYYSLEYLPTR